MDWRIELNKIYTVLEENNLKQLLQELQEAQLIGGTGGEIFMIMSNKLIEIKKTNPKTYSLIKTETDKIINYGIEIKYLKRESCE